MWANGEIQNDMTTINVIDSMMGVGKTHRAIELMNDDYSDKLYKTGVEPTKWIYITPFLDEVTRIKEACPLLDFREPTTINFGAKRIHFEHLIKDGHNIITTHALFPHMTLEGLQSLKEQGYMLIIDEAVSVVEVYSRLNKRELRYLQKTGMMSVDEAGIHLNNRTTNGYSKVVNAYYLNLDTIDPEGLMAALENNGFTKVTRTSKGKILFTDESGESEWRAAVRAGTVKPGGKLQRKSPLAASR